MPRTVIPTIALAAALLISSAAAFQWLSTDSVAPSTSRILDSLPWQQAGTNSTDYFANRHLGDLGDHAPLFPLQPEDLIGFFLAALGLILAAGGGIGGGGILVPIYILVLGFMPKHAIPLSNVTVFGGAVANTIRNVSKRHPNADVDRPLIDWDMILVMEPSTLAGALIGANLNKVLSTEIIAVMLVVLLTFTTYNTLKKAVKLYRKESVELMKNSASDMNMELSAGAMTRSESTSTGIKDDSDAKSIALLDNSLEYQQGDYLGANGSGGNYTAEEFGTRSNPPSPNTVIIDLNGYNDYNDKEKDFPQHVDPLLKQILDEERHPNRNKIAVIVVMFIVVLTINILKGGGTFQPLGIQCGSAAFWLAQVLLLLWIFIIAVIARKILIKDVKRKINAGYPFLPNDVQWDGRSTVVYPLISTLSGFCAGMFGIGGGIVKGPLMLAMGVHPLVASATSSCMILFTSFTATTTFALYGLLVTDYAVVCVLLGFFATLLGHSIIDFVFKSKRNSYIVFSIGLVVLFSAVLMTLQSAMLILSKIEEDEEMSGICEIDDM